MERGLTHGAYHAPSVRRTLAFAPLALLALAAAGCGGSGGTDKPPGKPKPTASVNTFPAAKGKTLDSLPAGLPQGPILPPSPTSSLQVGRNPVRLALFTPRKKFLTKAA